MSKGGTTDEEAPSLKGIASDLRRVVKDGIGRIPDSASLPVLSSLLCVRQETTGPHPLDVVMAVERLVARAIETLQGTSAHDVLVRLIGLTPETNDALAKQRRRAAADKARIDPETFARHDEQRYLQLLARRIYAVESEARLLADRLGPQPDPAEIEARWLERFTRYQRLASILRQLRLDLIAVLVTYRVDHGEPSRVDALDSTLWLLARFFSAVEAFAREMGGIWLMPEPAADNEAKSAIDLTLWHQPFNERGRSWLRTAIAQAPGGELFDFAKRLHDGPDGNELLGLWEQWLESCQCDLEDPAQDCRPHRVVDQAERFDMLVEEQWPRVRSRYEL